MEEAKELYHRGEYQAAIDKWEITLKSVEYTLNSADFDSDLDDKGLFFNKKRIDLLLNIALACLKLGNYNRSINLCLKVLSLDKYNEKALLRISKAYLLYGDYNNSIKYANVGLNQYKTEEFTQIIAELKRKRSQRDEKEIRLYRHMLNISNHQKQPFFRKILIAIGTIGTVFYKAVLVFYNIFTHTYSRLKSTIYYQTKST